MRIHLKAAALAALVVGASLGGSTGASAASWRSCPTGYHGTQGYNGGRGIIFGGLRAQGIPCGMAREALQTIAVNYRYEHRYMRKVDEGLAGSWRCTYSTPVGDFGAPLHYGKCAWSHGGAIRFRVG